MSDAAPQVARDAVYAALTGHAKGLHVSIGIKRLARQLEISDTTVSTTMRRLVSDGWIVVRQPPRDGLAGSYRIVPEEARTRQRTPLEYLVTEAWPIELLRKLVALWEENLSTTKIGERLGFSKNSIIGKVHRLIDHGVIDGRPSPVVRGDGPPKPRKAPVVRDAKLPPLKSEAPKPVAKLEPVRLTVFVPRGISKPTFIDFRSSIPRPEPRPKFVADGGYPLGPSLEPCQWPMVDGSVTRPWIFCGVTRVSWPYCAEHRKRAYGRHAEEAA